MTLYFRETGFEARLLTLVTPEPLFASERTVLTLKRRVRRIVFTPAGPKPVISWFQVPHRLVRSLDGTRALLVPVDGSGHLVPLASGTHRVEFVYRLTGAPGLPDLSRQGDASDESFVLPLDVPATPDPIVDPEA